MFRFYSYRVPHLEEKEGPFFDTFLTLIAVLRSATVVKMATNSLQSHFLAQLEDPEKHRKKDPLFLPDVALCRGKPRTRKAVS